METLYQHGLDCWLDNPKSNLKFRIHDIYLSETLYFNFQLMRSSANILFQDQVFFFVRILLVGVLHCFSCMNPIT